ncbi:MAG: pseudouridine-5'-phosphate glycosidase [Gemmataceae bacterium]
MNPTVLLDIRPTIAAALRDRQPVVALESSVIAHGLPWPANLETARQAEAAARGAGAVPATIAVLNGTATIGLTDAELETLAQSKDVVKVSRRDLAGAIARGQTAATTVAATMYLAHRAGLRFFATGGIGGAHRDCHETWDISADLLELARVPVAVVCAGAKSILDIPRTLELLETFSVPVIGYQTNEFPAFHMRTSGEPLSVRADSPEEAAAIVSCHWQLDGAGVVVAQPVAEEAALQANEFAAALREAEAHADRTGVRGPALTPFLLARLAEITEGRTLHANQELIIANARLAAEIAKVLPE